MEVAQVSLLSSISFFFSQPPPPPPPPSPKKKKEKIAAANPPPPKYEPLLDWSSRQAARPYCINNVRCFCLKGIVLAMMSRRFVHVLVYSSISRPCAYTLHSINASSLFYPERPSRIAATMEDDLLPQPVMRFHHPSSPPEYYGSMDFMPLGRNRNDIVGVDHKGRAILCDTTLPAVRTMPTLHSPKSYPISIAAGNSLYVMNSRLGPPEEDTFEALLHGPMPNCFSHGWFWRSLPPPPYVHNSDYGEDELDEESGELVQPYEITSYTVVADSQIWISTSGAGTYSFDTASGTWSKPGEWSLPFAGSAEFVPEHKLWFGFSSSEERQFCACDLTCGGGEEQPSLREVWELDLGQPQDWTPTKSFLAPLGSGKFCIVKLFTKSEDVFFPAGYKFEISERFAVVTGVEVESVHGMGLRMIKHKSKRYCLEGRFVRHVI